MNGSETPDKAQQRYLLRCARAAIQSKTIEEAYSSDPAGSSLSTIKTGAFVTLHKSGNLRGCIGRMTSDQSLPLLVQSMAIAAAYQDPRFPPLSTAELSLVDIEISVLSAMIPAKPRQVIPGKHGVWLSLHGYTGVFLPQVATEQGWDRETLLANLCRKAGLPSESHLHKAADLRIFTACVFGEKELGGT